MNHSRMQCLAVGALVVAACLLPSRIEAQSVARRVASVRDGKVRMSFASRPDICGYGNGITTRSDRVSSNRTNWSSKATEDVVYDDDCSEGPARVVVTLRGGHVERVRTYVGGRWRSDRDATDLGVVPVREAVDYLLSVASSESGKGAGEAIFPTTVADSVQVAQPLFTIAKNESRPREVRDQAVFWLSQVDDERAVGMLEDILRTARDGDIRDKAIFGLSQHRSGKGYAILRTYAENANEPEDLRGKAIFWLGQKRAPEGGQYLRTLYSRLRSEELKDKVIFSISQQKDEESMKWLVDLASSSGEPIEMRKKALFWAGQSGGSLDKLVTMYDRMKEREMKDQMIFVFSQRHERPAIDKLMDIARNDPDREARRKAMFWLGQSKDTRVAAFLSDMINR
jgi:HEAT repeat protein